MVGRKVLFGQLFGCNLDNKPLPRLSERVQVPWLPKCSRLCLRFNHEEWSWPWRSEARVENRYMVVIDSQLLVSELCPTKAKRNWVNYEWYKEKQFNSIYGKLSTIEEHNQNCHGGLLKIHHNRKESNSGLISIILANSFLHVVRVLLVSSAYVYA